MRNVSVFAFVVVVVVVVVVVLGEKEIERLLCCKILQDCECFVLKYYKTVIALS